MVLKVDIKKAYDWLQWEFTVKALNAWGFSVEVQQLIRSCLCSIQYSLLLNGGITRSFSPSRV